jgi:hypothetical protein
VVAVVGQTSEIKTMADNKGGKQLRADAPNVDDVLMKARDIWRRDPTVERSLLKQKKGIFGNLLDVE